MKAKNDLLNDILPMIIDGILDPKCITGEHSEEEDEETQDRGQSDEDKAKGGPHGRS
jgi:hypothetical protein